MTRATLCLLLAVLGSQGRNKASAFTVSGPYMHTLNLNGSVSVTCEHDNTEATSIDGKLESSDGTIVCELNKNGCDMDWDGLTKVTYTLWNLQAGDEEKLFKCLFANTWPLPIMRMEGRPAKLFPGSKIPFPPPRADLPPHSISGWNEVRPVGAPTDPLVWVLTGTAGLLCLYSFIITILFLKVKASRTEVLYDTLTYLPMQHYQAQTQTQGQARTGRGPRDVSEEYMDMREVQKTWPPDMNHNSQVDPSNFTA